jgi:hypothetical protein
VRALGPAGFTPASAAPGHGPWDIRLDHPSGLPLELHAKLFALPFYSISATEAWERSGATTIAGVAARILSPEHALVHVCGHASYSASRASLRWVCDAWFIIDRESGLDWHEVLDVARRARLTLPLYVMLRYLSDTLGARVPGAFLARLAEAFDRAPAVERDVALFAARIGARQPLLAILRRMPGGWRMRARVLLWLLFPSREYLRGAALGRPSSAGPVRYLSRPIGYAAHALRFSMSAPIRRARTGAGG